ncbi:MAG: hypothetical protein WCQ69_07525 [Bacteroidales bacterium]|jgi:hypothetical protein|nr:hypothetical protein [Bacteroidales bacterium]MDD2263733.1 hypothetical protein [Bacteroidales bacterium]MDD2831049.1 hypothetical protein [Bacteroidales bacterium]MDD3208143.1 hypothetical protein [Bacteroidales bacterium]MDD3696815.1 hypothetical protein [Bacteroidales bacterium]
MKKKVVFMLLTVLLGCSTAKTYPEMSNITEQTVTTVISHLTGDHPGGLLPHTERGIRQAASLWRKEDGSQEDFINFCLVQYCSDEHARNVLFTKLSKAFENIFGTSNQLSVELKKPVHLQGDELLPVDYILGNYEPSAHFMEDMFTNKTAFVCVLNFPNYTLEEKDTLGKEWNRLQWAYARMGDLFTHRTPAFLNQEMAQALGNAENYIASYNIMMGNLLTEDGRRLFPRDMVLLSHWNLRDEIKSNYAGSLDGLEKQQMIQKVMEHIVCQTIPQCVINDTTYEWKPYSNTVYKEGVPVEAAPEKDRRYEYLLATYRVEKKMDPYYPNMPTAIIRNFEGSMEIPAHRIEELFINLISSEQVKKVAALIEKRLERKLEPFDIWYDGFKSRTAIPEDELTALTSKRYPNAGAFRADMPRMLQVLGFTRTQADRLASRIVVEPARGSGHAWGAVGRWEPSRLRTRIGNNGMDYKGYNIAVHEFGHNVEQTLSLYDVDHYLLGGVPNTAFTEALAFVFQKRDLQLLGYPSQKMDDNTVLDIFWGCYEIMGVALVDMYVWQWLYENPDATAETLKQAVLDHARKVWNLYYEPVFGQHDSPLLAIYSHMINSPMYLPNYPFGHIIEFQLEAYFNGRMKEEGGVLADEIMRMFTQGRLVPALWMEKAVGSSVNTEPLLRAVDACDLRCEVPFATPVTNH